MSCGCDSTIYGCDPCDSTTGCPLLLDFDCVLYHKSNSQITQLDALGLQNGATLTMFAEAVDNYVDQIKVSNYTLTYLRGIYTINSLKQFAESVDAQLSTLRTDVNTALGNANIPITPIDSLSIDLTISGTGSHTVKADAIVSTQANNLLSILSDGLFSAPQTLSVNYSTKTLTISNGNSVSLAGLACGVGGFLGNVVADPGAVLDGQYWFNVIDDALRIKLNGAVREITIT